MINTLGRRFKALAIAPLVISAVLGTAAASPSLARASAHASSHASNLAVVGFIFKGLSVQPPKHKKENGKLKMKLFNQYFLQTAKSQRASIKFKDGTVLHMNQHTDALLRSPHVTVIKKGVVDEVLAPGTSHKVQTSTAVAAAIGTNFVVKVSHKVSYITVLDGSVTVTNKIGTVVVQSNQQSVVPPNSAPEPPVHVNATGAAKWAAHMLAPHLGQNVALSANGAAVVGFSSQYRASSEPHLWDATHLIDGQLNLGWASASGETTNQWIKVELAGDRVQTISKVIIDPAATADDPNTADLKDFEIRVSTTGTDDSDFTTVLTGTCDQKDSLQSFSFPQPVQARYVELYAVNNYGSPDWVSAAEMEVVGQLGVGNG